MRGLSYRELAGRYELDLCDGGCFRTTHEQGSISRGTIHWRERGVTRSGLRRFLMLVGEAEENKVRLEPGPPHYRLARAEWLHRMSMFAYRTALNDLGIRFSAKLAEADKAMVRHLLVREPYAVRRGTVGRWAGLR